jgi:hypothetical protein
LLFIGIKAEEDKTEVLINDGPAGASSLSARLPSGCPCTVNECPPEERRNNFPEKEKGHEGEDRVEHPVEQVMSYPADDTNVGDWGS